MTATARAPRMPSKARPDTTVAALNRPMPGIFTPLRERCWACNCELHLLDGPAPEFVDAQFTFYGLGNRETVRTVRVYAGKNRTPKTDGKQCCCNMMFCHAAHLRGEKLPSFDQEYAEVGQKMLLNWPRPPERDTTITEGK